MSGIAKVGHLDHALDPASGHVELLADFEAIQLAQWLKNVFSEDTNWECEFPSKEAEKQLFVLAVENEIAPMIAHNHARRMGWGNIGSNWRQEHAESERRLSAFLAELDRIATLLAHQGIPLVGLKNVGIARGIYACAACCPMGDVDVLVEKLHFQHVHDILMAEGYHFEFRSPLEEAMLEMAVEAGGAEYWKMLPNGERLWFELQWRPVAGRWIQPDQEPSAEELMARSISIPGSAVRLLAPEDNLLQVALHTAKHSYVRAPGFRLHLDVERIVRAYPDLDWEVFLQRVVTLQVKTPVYFSLVIPNTLFDTPIPDHVLEALRPPAWKERLLTRWIRRAGLLNPNERKFSRVGYILFNVLLYDDLRGLWQAVLPSRAWMRERYGVSNDLILPFYHARRLFDLAFRRLST